MALNKTDRMKVVKEAYAVNKERDIKFTPSLGSVYIDKRKFTDGHYATQYLKGKGKV